MCINGALPPHLNLAVGEQQKGRSITVIGTDFGPRRVAPRPGTAAVVKISASLEVAHVWVLVVPS